jgi:predicted DNA-binding transcriptional regulator AlpA
MQPFARPTPSSGELQVAVPKKSNHRNNRAAYFGSLPRRTSPNVYNTHHWGNDMTVPTIKTGPVTERLLTAKEAARFLRVSLSWLAKARMRGDGPPFVKIGRSIRYAESALTHWMRSRQRFSTSEY